MPWGGLFESARLYLALITWAFAEVVRNYLRMHFSFTGGDRGLDSALLFGTLKPLPYYYLFLGITIFTLGVIASSCTHA